APHEGPARNPEHLRGLRLVARALVERVDDALPLRGGIGGRRDRRGGWLHLLEGQRVSLDEASCREEHRALHHVAELTDVAGPAIAKEERQRIVCDAERSA